MLDLGSGTGLDTIIAARAVAPTGSATGLDFARAMVSKATGLAAASATTNVRFVHGSAEEMPLPARHFDAMSVNGLLNLCPEKPRVVREMARVLKPGGRAVVAEISFSDPLPVTEVQAIADWFR